MSILFCANCNAYLGQSEACPACGQSPPGRAEVAARWTVELEAAPSGTPVVTRGLLVLPTQEGVPVQQTTLLALDLPTQEIGWRCPLPDLLVNDPIVAHDVGPASPATGGMPVLYVAGRSTDPLGKGALLALDAVAGRELWRWQPGAQAISAPCLVGNALYVVLDDNLLYAVEARTGQAQWHLALPMPRSVAAAASSPARPGRIYLPSRGPHLCAVDVVERTVVWHHTSPDDTEHWFLATPVLVEDRLIVVSSGGAVLALDVGAGRRLWRCVPGRKGRPLSPPTVEGGRLYVGGSGGLYALDLSSGRELWSFATKRRIEARPLVVDGAVYAACRDHHLYALDANTGQELWQVETERRFDFGPAVAGDLVIATSRGGRVVAIERVLSAEGYAEQNRWQEAAVVHARNGQLPAAAGIFQEQLGQPLQAAELWRAAGDLEQAAAAYAQAERYDLAEACYLQLDQMAGVAEMAARQGDYDRAATLFEEAGEWKKARDCYDRLGNGRRVAELSEEMGDWQRAASEWQALGEVSRAAGALCRWEKWAEAGQLYEQMEDWPRAVECHERAGNWELVGQIHRWLKDYAAAARAYIQAAHALEDASPEAKSQLVELWSKAEQCCMRANDETQAEDCRRRLALHRGLPYIEAEVAPLETMQADRFGYVRFILHNRGGGEARQIIVHRAPGEFGGDLSATREFRSLLPGKSMSQLVSIRPLVSGPVPLVLSIDFVDDDSHLHEITFRTHITVVDAQEARTEPPAAPAERLATVLAFADFDLWIGRRRGDVYPTRVESSPSGAAEGTFRLPWAPDELAEILQRLETGETGGDFLPELGSRLFSAIFEGHVASRFRESQGRTAQGKGLRLRLSFGSEELLGLPWELLYDREKGEFLCLTQRASIVHHLPVARPTACKSVPPPLKMLIVPASPRDMPALRVQDEVSRLKRAVKPLVSAGALALDVLEPPTARALKDHLVDHRVHILHFMGHGGFDGRQGFVALEDEKGLAHRLDGRTLGMLLSDTPVQLAVLNACLTACDAAGQDVGTSSRAYLGVAPALVNAGLLAVVGMQFSLSDEGARLFAQEFYQMMARRKPVDEAVDQARVTMALDLGLEWRDWVAPVLYLQSSSGEIFPVQ